MEEGGPGAAFFVFALALLSCVAARLLMHEGKAIASKSAPAELPLQMGVEKNPPGALFSKKIQSGH